jgi:hypothetical protein
MLRMLSLSRNDITTLEEEGIISLLRLRCTFIEDETADCESVASLRTRTPVSNSAIFALVCTSLEVPELLYDLP